MKHPLNSIVNRKVKTSPPYPTAAKRARIKPKATVSVESATSSISPQATTIETTVYFVVKGSAVVMASLEQWQCQEYIDAAARMNPRAKVKPELRSTQMWL